eukprot:TRINITY_DN5257_c0_g2_i1.p1 TRINITY_DN5257_c0_g2~~TRINITY_DN5257_c0_g2_i1.p1  ORF type:complete len:292 (+),score=17.82 TRINITY_DN5257_c0_g2_i1:101-877(+)
MALAACVMLSATAASAQQASVEVRGEDLDTCVFWFPSQRIEDCAAAEAQEEEYACAASYEVVDNRTGVFPCRWTEDEECERGKLQCALPTTATPTTTPPTTQALLQACPPSPTVSCDDIEPYHCSEHYVIHAGDAIPCGYSVNTGECSPQSRERACALPPTPPPTPSPPATEPQPQTLRSTILPAGRTNEPVSEKGQAPPEHTRTSPLVVTAVFVAFVLGTAMTVRNSLPKARHSMVRLSDADEHIAEDGPASAPDEY